MRSPLRGGVYELSPRAVVATDVRWSSKVAEMKDMVEPEITFSTDFSHRDFFSELIDVDEIGDFGDFQCKCIVNLL